jgi:glycosyltransferase involved in cell wall biosynthesis
MRDLEPHLVHAHWTYEYELASQDSGIPHVTTAHDSPLTILRYTHDFYRLARFAVAYKARSGIRHLSAVSPYLADRWRTQMRYRGPIAVIPNPMPIDLPARRAPSDHPVVLDVASSGPLKNVGTLLKAFRLARRAIPEAELRLAGPGLANDGRLARWAAKEGLQQGVTFMGPLDRAQLAIEYARSWILVHPAREEACPMVILEALGAGLPVIGGDRSGGVPFVLDHGRLGVLTDIRSHSAIAARIVDALEGGPPTIVPSASAHAFAKFSPQSVVDKYLEWYESVS